MKWQIKCVVLAVFSALLAQISAQEEEATGKIRVVNLVNKGEGKTWMTLDDEPLSVRGYKTGRKSGLFGLKLKSHKLEVKRKGCESLKIEVLPEPEQNQVLLFHSEAIVNEEGEVDGWKIDHLIHNVDARSDESVVTLISFVPTNELKVTLDRGAPEGLVDLILAEKVPQVVSLSSAGRWLTLLQKKKELKSLHLGSPTEMIVIIYQDDEGDVRIQRLLGR